MAQSIDSSSDFGLHSDDQPSDDPPSDSERRRSQQGAEQRSREAWAASPGDNAGEPWQRWWPVQASFVDDPQSALRQAHGLVREAVEDAVRRLEGERDQLEQSWSRDGDVSTEDKRRALQRYRELYGRLLGNTSSSIEA
jgi:hypothetical protein